MTGDRLEELHREAVPAIVAGGNLVELPTGDGSPRWGLSVNLRPDPQATERVADLATEVLRVLGDPAEDEAPHWPTGTAASSHLTLRPLEPHRTHIPADDPTLGRYISALRRACRDQPPVRFRLGRIGLAPACVLLGARPVDDSCDRLYGGLAHELGSDGWFQDGVVRDLWYLSLVHFGRPLDDGPRLVAWAERRRRLDLGTTTCDRVQVIQWRLAAGAVDATVLAEVDLGR